jgi:N-acetylmuramic acid 6-phosphate etherase
VTTMIRLGKVYENLMVDLQTRSDKLVARAKRIVAELSGVSEAEAVKALRKADGRTKVAIVMLSRKVSPERAFELLEGSGGMLRGALES